MLKHAFIQTQNNPEKNDMNDMQVLILIDDRDMEIGHQISVEFLDGSKRYDAADPLNLSLPDVYVMESYSDGYYSAETMHQISKDHSHCIVYKLKENDDKSDREYGQRLLRKVRRVIKEIKIKELQDEIDETIAKVNRIELEKNQAIEALTILRDEQERLS